MSRVETERGSRGMSRIIALLGVRGAALGALAGAMVVVALATLDGVRRAALDPVAETWRSGG